MARNGWMVLIVVSVVVALFAPAFAVAGSLHQSYEFAGDNIRADVNIGQWGSEVNLSANVDTTWVVDSVFTSLDPQYNDPSEFVWSVYVQGRRELGSPIQQSSNMTRRTDAVYFTQHVSVSWWGDVYPDGQHGGAFASATIDPATFEYARSYYNEWEQSEGGGGKGVAATEGITTKWWSTNFRFEGSFGDGPEGDAIGLAYFGLPEPATIGLLAFGALFLRRRR